MRRRLITLVLAVALVLTMIPVAGSFAYADSQITGVKLTGNILSWDPYEGATKYALTVNGEATSSSLLYYTSTSVDLQKEFDNDPILLSGMYQIFVDAYKGEDDYIPGSSSELLELYEYKSTVPSYPAPEPTIGSDYIVRWNNTAPQAVPYIDIQEKDEEGWHNLTYLSEDGEKLCTDTWLEQGTTSYYVGQYMSPGKTYRVLVRFEPAAGVTGIKNSPDVFTSEFPGPSAKAKNPVVDNVDVDASGNLTWDKVDLPGVDVTYKIVVNLEPNTRTFTSDKNSGFYLAGEMDGADLPDGDYHLVIYPYIESQDLAIYDASSDPYYYSFERLGKGAAGDPGVSAGDLDISKAKVKVKNMTWTGKTLKPAVKATIDGAQLTEGANFKVTYKNNKNVGKATVTLKGINGCTGTVKKTFRINPKGTTVKSVTAAKKALTVKWTKQAKKMSKKRITGYQVWVSTSSKFTKKTTKKVNVKGYSKTSKKITGLKANKKYYVKIRTYKKIGKVTYYSPWSKAKAKKTK